MPQKFVCALFDGIDSLSPSSSARNASVRAQASLVLILQNPRTKATLPRTGTLRGDEGGYITGRREENQWKVDSKSVVCQ